MSSSYLPASDKISLGNEFYNVHDTWARPITIFQTATEVVINTNPNNNPFFPDSPNNDTVQTVIQSGVFNARVKWNPKQDFNLFTNGAGEDTQNTLRILQGVVRIKLDATGASYMQGSERYFVDGELCEPYVPKRQHGLFAPNFYTFYLRRVN